MATIDYRNTGIVTKPISLKAVADLLNSSGVGKTAAYDVGSVCTSERVNKWARYKPFRSNRISFVQDEDSTVRDKDGALSDVHFGLKINSMSQGYLVNDATNDKYGSFGSETIYNYDISKDEDSFLHKLATGDLDDWQYIARTAPFRLADFSGYKHNCVSPLPYVQSENLHIPLNTSGALLSKRNNIDVGNISLGDISLNTDVNLDDFFTCILFYNSNLTNCFVLTSSGKISEADWNKFGIKQQGLRNEVFYMKTFLCSEELKDSVNIHGIQAYFVGCDMKEESVCNIYMTKDIILKVETLKTIGEGANKQVSLRVSIHNYSGMSVYVTEAGFGDGEFVWTNMDSLNSAEPLESLQSRTYSNASLSSLDVNNSTIFSCKVNGVSNNCTGGEGATAKWEIKNDIVVIKTS